HLKGTYGTLGFKGLVERSLEKDGWKYTISDLELKFIDSGTVNETKEIRVGIGLAATQRPRVRNGYWKQLFEKFQPTDKILNATTPELKIANTTFIIPKDAAEQATVIGLFVRDGPLLWPLCDDLKAEPTGVASEGKSQRSTQNSGSSSSSGGD